MWKRIYEEAAKKFGMTNIPVNTFNKVWIVPEKAVVYENAKAGTAYVVESKLKVMLEQDYLSISKHNVETPFMASHEKDAINRVSTTNNINALGSQIVREIVIPELTREVNENKNFAQLRQVYNSLILATWYKKKIKDSILEQVYADRNKVAGVNIDDPQEKEKIYQRYLQAFKKGVFNYVKEDAISIPGMPSKEQGILPRKYFSGGIQLDWKVNAAMVVTTLPKNFQDSGTFALVSSKFNVAMISRPREAVAARRTKELEILERQELPVTVSQLIKFLQAEEGYADVKADDVRHDVIRDGRLKGHDKLIIREAIEVDRQAVAARRAKELEILGRQESPVTVSQLIAFLQAEEGYAQVDADTVRRDVARDERLKDNDKLKKEVDREAIAARRAQELKILRRQESPVTVNQLITLLQAQKRYADVKAEIVKHDVARDDRLKDHKKLIIRKVDRKAIAARQAIELRILMGQKSPITVGRLTELLRAEKGYADVKEYDVRNDVAWDKRLKGHDKLIGYQEFIRTQLNAALADERVKSYLRAYASQTPRKNLWAGDLLKIIKEYGFYVPLSPAYFYGLLPKEIKVMVSVRKRTFILDESGQLYVKPYSSSPYYLYNFSKVGIKGNQSVDPLWGKDGTIKAFEIPSKNGQPLIIQASAVIAGGIASYKVMWQYTQEYEKSVPVVVDSRKNALEVYESKERETEFTVIIDEFARKNHHSTAQYMDFLVSLFQLRETSGIDAEEMLEEAAQDSGVETKWAESFMRYLMLPNVRAQGVDIQGPFKNIAEYLSNRGEFQRGGIDLATVKDKIQTDDIIRFHIDPAQLAQLQNAPGFVPVIINIQPMRDLQGFLERGELYN